MVHVSRLIPLLAAGALPAAGAVDPPQVAFKQFPGDRQAIVRLDEAGRDVVELTRGKPTPSEFGSFSWSPDGSRLVYASDGIVGGDLYSLRADGGELGRLTSDGGNDNPAWSPNGERIAYVHTERVRLPSGLFRLDAEISLVSAAGGDRRRLTNDAGQKYAPQWSPDGSRIVYSRLGPGSNFGTFVIEAASGRRLLATPGNRGAWSPDGTRLAIETDRGIDVLAADGTRRRTVARRSALEPRWSPDGTRLAFVRRQCVASLKGICSTMFSSVYDVGAVGGAERRLTGPISQGAGSEVRGIPSDDSDDPAWWPGGSKLFFRRQARAHVMNADGTCERPFGPPTLLLGRPHWRPGSSPPSAALRCADLRVRATSLRLLYGRRDTPRVRIVVENDGNQTATGILLTLRVADRHGRVRARVGSCRGAAFVRCALPPIAPGRARQLVVETPGTRRPAFRLYAAAVAREFDSDATQNSSTAYAYILDCDIVGTLGSDRLEGTPRHDTICGLTGADVIAARGGNDRIEGGAGADTIRPGSGRDVVAGGEGRERIYARDGQRDVIDCGPYLDTVYADRADRVVRCERVSR